MNTQYAHQGAVSSAAAESLLDELTAQPSPAPALGATGRPKSDDALSVLDRPSHNVSSRKPKMSYSHEAMIDLMLSRPGISGNELADYFGYTPGWISTVRNSDAFKALYAQRRSDLCDPELIASIRERLETVATQSLRVLTERLSRNPEGVSDELVMKAADMSTKALGFGARAAAVQVNVTSEARISSLAHRLIALKRGSDGSQVIDV